MLKFYAYKGCDSCRKARKWLRERAVDFEEIAIRDCPPDLSELRRAEEILGLKRLFNTAGGDYRELGLKDKLPGMTVDEALGLLATRGNLVKRPFVISDELVITGFKPEEWESVGSG